MIPVSLAFLISHDAPPSSMDGWVLLERMLNLIDRDLPEPSGDDMDVQTCQAQVVAAQVITALAPYSPDKNYRVELAQARILIHSRRTEEGLRVAWLWAVQEIWFNLHQAVEAENIDGFPF